jgi:hypothetical protein
VVVFDVVAVLEEVVGYAPNCCRLKLFRLNMNWGGGCDAVKKGDTLVLNELSLFI